MNTCNKNSVSISKECFKEVIVVGGGTCGLAVCARLCEPCPGSIYTEDEHQRFHWLRQRKGNINLLSRNVSSNRNLESLDSRRRYREKTNFSPEEMLVLDSTSSNFLGQWDNQFESCQIPYLRSPMFFHPDPENIDGLVSFAHKCNKETPKDLMEIENVVGKEYSKHQHKKLIKKKMKKKKIPVPSDTQVNYSHDQPGLVDINMRDWKDYYRPSTELFHNYCEEIVDRYRLHNVIMKDEVVKVEYTNINVLETDESGQGFLVTTKSGAVFGSKVCVVASGHRGKPNYPIPALCQNPKYLEGSCHTTDIFQRKVEFPHTKISGKIDNGELTKVVIVGGGLTSAQMAHSCILSGVNKVYLVLRGPLKIKHFDFHLDWVTKYKNLKKSSFYLKDTEEERIDMINEAREGGSVNPEYYKKLMKHVKSKKLDIIQHSSLTDTEWKDDMLWNINLKSHRDDLISSISNVDYIYCATGISQSIQSLDFLNPIMKNHGIPIVNGFPCLTDELQWKKDIPLFLVGKNASLRVGPSSANLDGARLGAERIGWYIQDQRISGKLDWSCDHIEAEAVSSTSHFLLLASGQLNWYSLLDIE